MCHASVKGYLLFTLSVQNVNNLIQAFGIFRLAGVIPVVIPLNAFDEQSIVLVNDVSVVTVELTKIMYKYAHLFYNAFDFVVTCTIGCFRPAQ